MPISASSIGLGPGVGPCGDEAVPSTTLWPLPDPPTKVRPSTHLMRAFMVRFSNHLKFCYRTYGPLNGLWRHNPVGAYPGGPLLTGGAAGNLGQRTKSIIAIHPGLAIAKAVQRPGLLETVKRFPLISRQESPVEATEQSRPGSRHRQGSRPSARCDCWPAASSSGSRSHSRAAPDRSDCREQSHLDRSEA